MSHWQRLETFWPFLLWSKDPCSFCGLEKSITMENHYTWTCTTGNLFVIYSISRCVVGRLKCPLLTVITPGLSLLILEKGSFPWDKMYGFCYQLGFLKAFLFLNTTGNWCPVVQKSSKVNSCPKRFPGWSQQVTHHNPCMHIGIYAYCPPTWEIQDSTELNKHGTLGSSIKYNKISLRKHVKLQ